MESLDSEGGRLEMDERRVRELVGSEIIQDDGGILSGYPE